MSKEEVLQKCTVNGNVVKLPDEQLDRKLYLEVAKSLELIGGKWKGGKVYGFVFPSDPTELLDQIANGEKRNLKKEFQYFATPEPLARKLVEMAQIENDHCVLEPSAGQGAIVKAINQVLPEKPVYCYELMPVNQMFLSKIPTVVLMGDDFLRANGQDHYDRIIANPPFSNNQDIEHVQKMYRKLNFGGRMVTITSRHWLTSTNKKETEFRDWLEDIGCDIEEIEQGAFKESGTMVGGLILTICKN